MKTVLACVSVVFGVLLFTSTAMAQTNELIGRIQNVDGLASVQRGEVVIPGAVGMALYRGDRVRTGKPGAIGIVLTDDTTVSLGSGSELLLNEYAFDPGEGKFALVMRMIKGTFSYISGQISKLAPDAVQLQTPDATIAIRGTKLLVEIKG